MTNEKPPTDYLNHMLWVIGHSAKQRAVVIDVARKLTQATGMFCDPIDLGVFCMPATMFVKRPWYIRLKWWWLRKWREGYDAGCK